ncbi:MAG TPA: peptide chain release factor 1 [Allocoleopsis sp.]
MRNPLQRLRYLPWLQLSMAALLTALVIAIVEYSLFMVAGQIPAIGNVLLFLFSSPFVAILQFLLAIGVGAVAVISLDKLYPGMVINTAVLWALVPCVLLAIGLKSLLLEGSMGGGLVSLNEISLFGMIVGIFWKGRPYWR